MKKSLKKQLFAIIAFAFAICMMPATAKAEEEFEMGIVRMNIAKNSMALSGRKMEGALCTLNLMADKGIITRDSGWQSYDLDNDGNTDIGFDAYSTGIASFHKTLKCSITGIWMYDVPDTIKISALQQNSPYCDKFVIDFTDAENLALQVGISEGGAVKFSDTTDVADDALNRTVPVNQEITMYAIPDYGCRFVGWYEGFESPTSYFVSDHTGELLSEDSEYTFTGQQNLCIYALFSEDVCTDGKAHDWKEVAHKATFTDNGGVYAKCSKCQKEEFVTPLAAVNNVMLKTTSYAYDGKAKEPEVIVKNGFGDELSTNQYKVTYKNNINPGTATATVTLTSPWYEGTKTLNFTITGNGKQVTPGQKAPGNTEKKANPLTVKAKTVKVSAKKVAKKKQVIAKKKIMKITCAQGQVKFQIKKVSKAKYKKYFRINEKGGQIAIKKGLKKGTYKLKIKVTAAGNAKYKAGSKTVTVKVKVR